MYFFYPASDHKRLKVVMGIFTKKKLIWGEGFPALLRVMSMILSGSLMKASEEGGLRCGVGVVLRINKFHLN